MKIQDLMKARHSIRKYKEKQISRNDLEKILEAGNFAPNAGGGQRSMMVAVHNKDLTTKIGHLNMLNREKRHYIGSFVSKEQPSIIDDVTITNGFYGAPTVVAIFGLDRFLFRDADAFCCAENMVLQATALGIASCIVGRGKETFQTKQGIKLAKEWKVPLEYSCVCFVILGYIDGQPPHAKPRRKGRIKIIE